MTSAAWRALRRAALARDGHRCRLCDGADDLEAHHRRYPPRGRWHLDRLEALTTLCGRCHQVTTSELRRRRHAARTRPALGDVVRLTPLPAAAGPGGA